ncbi:MAG TPA: RDD family protein [Acidimicrobiales bacterium]
MPVDRLGRPLAAWWQRLLGILIDFVILGIPKAIVTRAVVSTTTGNSIFAVHWAVDVIIVGIVFAVIDLTYFGLLNGGDKGQTVGQMALGITVRDEATGGPIGIQRAGLRILVLYPVVLLAWIPVLGSLAGLYSIVAALSPLWDRRRQGFHDKVAHTDVIRVR